MLKVFGTSENPNKMEKGGLGLPPTASLGVGGGKKKKIEGSRERLNSDDGQKEENDKKKKKRDATAMGESAD